jgi:hypothetical protein
MAHPSMLITLVRYASSGINAAPPVGVQSSEVAPGDSADLYYNDTVRSSGREVAVTAESGGGGDGDNDLMSVLARESYRALTWFRTRVKLPLEVQGQMGGHTAPRTYRPSTGMAGSEMVFAITKQIKALSKDGENLGLALPCPQPPLPQQHTRACHGRSLPTVVLNSTRTLLARYTCNRAHTQSVAATNTTHTLPFMQVVGLCGWCLAPASSASLQAPGVR